MPSFRAIRLPIRIEMGTIRTSPVRFGSGTDHATPGAPTLTDSNKPLTDRVLVVLEAIRPMIQRDGGDIELVEITPAKVVRIRFQGACVGCPSSEMTLRMGIEDNLKTHVPEITGVEAVD